MSGELPSWHCDEEVVEANLQGLETRPLTTAEKRRVAVKLQGRGFTTQAISFHLGCGENRVKKLIRGDRMPDDPGPQTKPMVRP